MCPTSAACALGGTPPQRGIAGGHIKKASWVHVLDALPLRLKLPCEITRFKLDQFGAGQAAANAGFIDRRASVSSGRAEGAQLGGGELHDLGSLYLGDLLCCFDGAGVLAAQNQLPRFGKPPPNTPVTDDVLTDAQDGGQLANPACLMNCDVQYFHATMVTLKCLYGQHLSERHIIFNATHG